MRISKLGDFLSRAMIVAGILFATVNGFAQTPPGGGGGSSDITNTPLETWSFSNPTNWVSDSGDLPISFTNLAYSHLGNGQSMVLDTNVPAWLSYSVPETDGATNLTVDTGSVTFWFAPSWSSTNAGGIGPQEWGRLFEVGAYTTNSNYGWWSIYVDNGGNNLYFSAQTNDNSSSYTTFLSTPISWTTNYFHFLALTYSTNGTALYIDGAFVTNGLPLTVYPGANVLTNGFYLGGDYSGTYQAHGSFNDLATYNYPLNTDTVGAIYNSEILYYWMNPYNTPYMSLFSSAPSTPSYSGGTYDAISGQGNLGWVGYASTCSYGTSAYNVWITNVTATATANGNLRRRQRTSKAERFRCPASVASGCVPNNLSSAGVQSRNCRPNSGIFICWHRNDTALVDRSNLRAITSSGPVPSNLSSSHERTKPACA